MRDTLLGVRIVRNILFWGSILGSPIDGNYHVAFGMIPMFVILAGFRS